MLKDKRILAAVVAVILVVVAAVLVQMTRGGEDEPDNTASETPSETTSESPTESPTEESTEHEHDQVDTVDPNIDPADYQEFCDAFYAFANSYSSAVDTLDQTGEAPPYLVQAASDFRAVADQTDLTDEVRAGFEWFVDDVLRVENDASLEEQNAWGTFLNSACPA